MIRFAKTPTSVRLTLTNRCNLFCNFCLSNATSEVNEEELGTQEWLDFFYRLKELRVFNVSFSGGEIFLRNDLFVLLKKLRSNQMHRITLLTNGTLISKDKAVLLKKLNIKNISISLDGLKDKHNKIRGKGAFEKTVQGIKNLIEIGIFPQVSFIPIRDNFLDMAPLIDYIAATGVSAFKINTLTPEGRCVNIYKDIVLEYPQQVKEVLDSVEKKSKDYPGLNIKCHLGFYYHLPETYKYYLEKPQNYEIKHLKSGCGAASTSCTISPTGDVIPCEGLADFSGGNIREHDLLDIWRNSENFKIIRNLATVPMNQTPNCKNCKYIFLCDGGCRATAYLVYKDLQAPSVHCPYFNVEKPFEEEKVGN